MFAIPRRTYVSKMDTLSQIMARVHFDHFFQKNNRKWKNNQKVKSFGMDTFYVY